MYVVRRDKGFLVQPKLSSVPDELSSSLQSTNTTDSSLSEVAGVNHQNIIENI